MHQNKNQNNEENMHIPVLLNQTLEYLDPKQGDSYLDLTGGYGGHAAAVFERTGTPERAVLVDRDLNAVRSLEQRFNGSGVDVQHTDFLSASRLLKAENKQFDLILRKCHKNLHFLMEDHVILILLRWKKD